MSRLSRVFLVFLAAVAAGGLLATFGPLAGDTTPPSAASDRAASSAKTAPAPTPSPPPPWKAADIELASPATSQPSASPAPADTHRPPALRPGYSDPEEVARSFLQAYASFDWRDPDPNRAVRERTRPWATDALNEFLDTGSSAAHMTQQRVQAEEVATLEIVSMDPISPRGADLVTFTSLGLRHKQVDGPTPEPRAQFYELTVVRQGDRWLVDRIRL